MPVPAGCPLMTACATSLRAPSRGVMGAEPYSSGNNALRTGTDEPPRRDDELPLSCVLPIR